MQRAKRSSTANNTKASGSAGKRKTPPTPRPAEKRKTPPAPKGAKRQRQEVNQDTGLSQDQQDRLTATIAAQMPTADTVADKVIDKLLSMGVLNTTPPPPVNPPPPAANNTASASASLPGPPPGATNVVADGAVTALLYGEPTNTPSSNSSEMELAYHVPDPVRAKITSDQYVDFKTLMPGSADPHMTLKVDGAPGDQTIRLASASTAKAITSIDQWTTAYTNFQFVYIQAKPDAAPKLLKYQETVRELNRRFGFNAARQYDEEFRKLKARVPSMCFSTIHSELWLKTATPNAPPNTSNFRPSYAPRPQSSPRPNTYSSGTCNSFNAAGTRCSQRQCKYQHACSACSGPHPRYKCPSTTSTDGAPEPSSHT